MLDSCQRVHLTPFQKASSGTTKSKKNASFCRKARLLTDEDCKRLMRAGRQGRIATAWRQLFSFGLALSNDHTQKLIESKWIPPPLFPDQLRGTCLCPSNAKELLTEDKLLQASRTLTAGSCTDARGGRYCSSPTASVS